MRVCVANDDRSIEIRFMNDDSTPPNMLGNIRTEQQIAQVMSNRRYKGLTPFGTKLRQKVIDGIVLPKLRQPRKPVVPERPQLATSRRTFPRAPSRRAVSR